MEERSTMDFVDWCSFILHKVIEASQLSSTQRSIGVEDIDLAHWLVSQGVLDQSESSQFTTHEAIMEALRNLESVKLLERNPFLKVTSDGKEFVADNVPLWHDICQTKLDEEQQQLLVVVNRLSPQVNKDYVWLKQVTNESLLSELSWAKGIVLLQAVAQELDLLGYINADLSVGANMSLTATYCGLVWQTRRHFTIESRLIDDLMREWETTSVDFKRELHLDKASEKAEFIKDVLSLAKTQASGKRWLIIGFKDKTRTYFGPPDPKVTQNRMEQIIAEYIDPYLDIDYKVIEYREGHVGKLEVIRDATKLPYRVKKQINGNKKPLVLLQGGDIFVRHGSQVQKPDNGELQALQEEGDRARSIDSAK